MSPLKYAQGGILAQSRTSFALSDGRFGVFGEGGPELGFFPLKRGKDGRLGVAAESQGSTQIVRTTNVSMVVKAEDPNAFRASIGQRVADAKRAARMGR